MSSIASSPEYQDAERRYARAILAEKQAWDGVRNCLPGTDAFEPQRWADWQSCVARSTSARMALLDLIQVTTVAGLPGFSANDPAPL